MDLFIPIERSLSSPLCDQLYGGLRGAILDGRLSFGAKLPASRALAKSLGLSRFTIDDAYSRLIADGYLVGRRGSGTFVAYERPPATVQPETRLNDPAVSADRHWSAWAMRLPAASVTASPLQRRFSFKQGIPALDPFPLALWRRCRSKAGQEMSAELFGYGSTRGYEPLREAISGYLARSRMLRVSPDRIVITAGTQQALDLVSRLFLDPNDRFVIEEPAYPTARRAFVASGATPVPVPVDRDGLQVDLLPDCADARLVYVTPSHQFPTGGVLPLGRRRELLAWARATGALIVEDDYDSEFRYGHRPIEALAALDASMPGAGSVIYIGTFSKVLFPSLRLGYLVLPPDLVGRVIAAKDVADRHPSTLDQATLATFIAEGHFERHLARMRRVYASRQSAVLEALAEQFGDRARRDRASTPAGLHVLVDFAVPYGEAELLTRAANAGVLVDPVSVCYLTPPDRSAALLGYAIMDEERIRAGIATLAWALLD